MKFRINFLIIILFVSILFAFMGNNKLMNYFNFDNQKELKINSKVNQYGKIKKVNIECRIDNEIINRDNIDTERECYYKCSNKEIVRVDTSIGYPCEKLIIEVRDRKNKNK